MARLTTFAPFGALLLTLLLLAVLPACPRNDTSAAEGTSGSEEPIQFPDEAAAVEADANAPPASPEVARAEGLLARGQSAEARAILEQVIATEPTDVRAHLDLGLSFELEANWARAEAAYRAALEIDPTFPEVLNNLGLVLREQDRLDEAIPQFRAALAQRPDYASATVNLALALEENGQQEDALQVYRTAIRLAPRDPLSRINFGLLLLEMGNTDQAAIELRRGLNLAGDDVAALAAVGSGLRRAGQPDAAALAMTRVVEEMGDEVTAPVLAELALAQRGAGDRESAEASLQRALSIDASFATAHYLLGNMLAGRQAFPEAIRHYRQYLRMEPNGAHADRARERLEQAQRQ